MGRTRGDLIARDIRRLLFNQDLFGETPCYNVDVAWEGVNVLFRGGPSFGNPRTPSAAPWDICAKVDNTRTLRSCHLQGMIG